LRQHHSCVEGFARSQAGNLYLAAGCHFRLTGAQVGRIDDRLFVDLKQHVAGLQSRLRRGAARTRHAAKMSVDDFVHRVAQREGISDEQAREHVRAVFETLREAIDRLEFLDITAQLPAEYATVGARP